MKEIKFNGLHINDYEGEGIPLIFVHAFPLNSDMFQPQVEFFKNKYRVITYDVRGLGKSKSDNNQFTMETYANDLLSIIEHLKLEKVFACGVSMGGYIILRSCIKNPEIFKCIILADTKAERDDDIGLINRSNVIANIKNGKKEEFISTFLPKLINKKSYSNDKLRTFLENILNNNFGEGICGAQLALATRTNVVDYLKSFNIPALILVGEDDELTPLSCSVNMNKLIPNSELIIIPDSGHLSNLENSQVFNKYIIEFLKTYI
jgi:3-oxoadipate enol-lactonase